MADRFEGCLVILSSFYWNKTQSEQSDIQDLCAGQKVSNSTGKERFKQKQSGTSCL